MTGPEHYREAERILAGVAEMSNRPEVATNHEATKAVTAVAQAHATLALAAATALNSLDMPSKDYEAWERAAAVDGVK